MNAVPIPGVVILADESAHWKVAGLRQLDRLILALNEFCAQTQQQGRMPVFVFWKPDEVAEQWLPDDQRLAMVRLIKSLPGPDSGWRILSTRLFVGRKALGSFFETSPAAVLSEASDWSLARWNQLGAEFERSLSSERTENWRFLRDANQCASATRQFLAGSGKPQDGLVSRFLNRPISRLVTRPVLKFPITPTAWTWSIFVLPFVSLLFLRRGDYFGFVFGTLLYHLHSILDGCDGEIARAKYQESKRGGLIDDFCDIFGCFLFVIGLGWGLWSQSLSEAGWLYCLEGIFCAAVMGANEWVLRLPKKEPEPVSGALGQSLYPRHRQLIMGSGLLFLGERTVWWLVQLTKRDVGILFFVFLALVNQAQWILHLSFLVAVISFTLTCVARLRPARVHPVSVGSG